MHVVEVLSVSADGNEIIVRAPDSASGVFDAPIDATYFSQHGWTAECYEWTKGKAPEVEADKDLADDPGTCREDEPISMPVVPEVPDSDEDGIPNESDNCPDTPNKYQIDSDGDGKGNECDDDPCPTYDVITGPCGGPNGCIEGFYCATQTIACEQETCPEGSKRTYTLECCCNCWEDQTLMGVYDPCRAGFLLECVPAE